MSRSSRRLFGIPLAVLAVLAVLVGAVAAEPLPRGAANGSAFEIDGDLLAADGGSLDWDDPLSGEPDGGVIDASRNPDGSCDQAGELTFGTPGHKGRGTLVCDGNVGSFADQDVFGSGAKEEEGEDPAQWTIQAGSVPKKADLSEVYAYATVGDSPFDDDPSADDVFLAVAMTRLDVNGDTHADFEYNQKPLTTDCTGATHCQDRTGGDLLLAVDLAAGAATPETRVFEFRDSLAPGETCAANQADPAAGCYVQIPTPESRFGDPSVVAVLNPSETAAPSWGTVGCEPVGQDKKPGCRPRARIPAGGTLEAYIDLSAFIHRDPELCPGFGQLTAKTRSSSSISASLSDIAAPVALRSSVCNSILIVNVDRRDQPVAGAGIHFDSDPFTSEEGATRTVIDGSPDDHAGGANGYVCVDGARYDTYGLLEGLVPDGYFGAAAAEDVYVASPSTCAQRLGADGRPLDGTAVDATFVNAQGSFLIKSLDERGNLVGGATFRVRTDPRSHEPGTSLDITDSDGDGLVCVEDVFIDAAARDTNQPTSYDVTQTKAPKNYTPDPTTQRVAITEPGTCAGETPNAPDATFVNRRGKPGK